MQIFILMMKKVNLNSEGMIKNQKLAIRKLEFMKILKIKSLLSLPIKLEDSKIN